MAEVNRMKNREAKYEFGPRGDLRTKKGTKLIETQVVLKMI